MKNIIIIFITLIILSSCSTSKKIEPETCELTDYKQVFDEMAFIVGKLREEVHILGTETNPDYSSIYSETSELLEKTKEIQAPSCLEKSKGLLISTIESALVGIDFYQDGESEKAINHINENTQEILNLYIEELILISSRQPSD
jgi:hypothetical protein